MPRNFLAVTIVVLALSAVGRAEDDALLDKFKKQNEAERDKVRGQIKQAIDKALAIEKDDPAAALALMQDTRDKMLKKAMLAQREDRELVAPVWERIKALQVVLRSQRSAEMLAATAEYRDYLIRINDELAAVRRDFTSGYAKDPPPGQPAYVAFVNGETAVGWLQETPQFIVRITINQEPHAYGPGTVAGLQTLDGFYLYNPAPKRFEERSSLAFFITAVLVHPPASKAKFWIPSKTPPPPPGFYKKSVGVDGAALFARSAGVLMSAWSGPNGQFPERKRVLAGIDPANAMLLRDAAVDLQVQEAFHRFKKEDQARIRDMVIGFLDSRSRDDALTSEEVLKLGDQIADAYPDRRADTLTFVLRMNRVLDLYASVRK